MTLLEAVNVWKHFGATVALANVSLSLDRGLHVVAGPNGSGKTTLLKIWSGLLRPSRGRVRVLNLDPWLQKTSLLKRVHVAFEDIQLPWWVSGLEYLRFVAASRGVNWGGVLEIAEMLEITGYWAKLIRGYSSGMRKRVLLAQALIGEPEIIILDEPYTLLDVKAVRVLHEVMRGKLKGEATVVIATHILTEFEDEATTLTVLRNGSVQRHYRENDMREKASIVCYDKETARMIAEASLDGVSKVIVKDGKVIVEAEAVVPLERVSNCKTMLSIGELYEEALHSEGGV
ncbi:MAG: ABC transporter ATP-binding protein [Desulfurococcales archaeon]|jgi:ABC-type multidrug transport system ATPase subunit|nr:ABC transporter ATP-binding protein [Desulfurococcales archaeon]